MEYDVLTSKMFNSFNTLETKGSYWAINLQGYF